MAEEDCMMLSSMRYMKAILKMIRSKARAPFTRGMEKSAKEISDKTSWKEDLT